MKFIATVVTAFAALAAAATEPDLSKDASGNPITLPGLNHIVPAGKPYTIRWDKTTDGEVSLILLRGPSTNVKPIATIADSIPNTGSFVWTPSTSLEDDVTHYGLMIVVEGTGQYQYSTQFGIKNDAKPEPSYVTSSPAGPSGTGSTMPPASFTSTRTLVPISTGTTTICPPTKTPSGSVSSGYPSSPPSGSPSSSPSGSPSASSTPTPSAPPFNGAPGRNGVAIGGIVVAAAVAIFAF
ncbi:lysophospholipase [[Emmonsia] crescens]|uniref:Lysophospholipase n=1 Tax=[Emmonsia] crescens TaxID=73230 RepID=A0A0G2HSN3_9EURO|nr:lysophospholipase [Emmonsia crescens UAMH 3008]